MRLFISYIRKKRNGVIFKIYFEKAYDKVKWPFLQQTLRMKEFSPKWCRWIEEMITKGSVGIIVNDEIGCFFQTKRNLHQGTYVTNFVQYRG
jgi:hypothetical protein